MGRDNHAALTGFFLVTLVLMTVVIVYWLGHFERERNLYVVSTRASVSGLNPESVVFFRGIAVGKVLNIQFDPNDTGTILVPIEVDKTIILSRGVFANLQLKGVTGLTQINLEDTGTIVEPLPSGNNPLYRIPLKPSLTDKLMNSGEDLLKKADHLMIRLSVLLDDKNTDNIANILDHLNGLTAKLADLQRRVDFALAQVPALSADARKTLQHFDSLTGELQDLTGRVKNLSIKIGDLADTGKATSDDFRQTTLPKMNDLLDELRTTSLHVKRMATSIENNPQSLLLGNDAVLPGPGESGFEVPK